MSVPVIADTKQTSDGRSSTEVLTFTGVAAGDTLIVFYGSDSYLLSNMPDVTSSAGTATPITLVDIGDNRGHIKAYTITAGTAGTHTVTIPAHIDCDIHGVALRLSPAVVVDAFASQFLDENSQTTHTAASVTTTGADRLLLCCWITPSGPSFTGKPYTPQVSMTEVAETSTSPFSAMLVASEAITSAGATGTRTATWVDFRRYGSITMAITAASENLSGTGAITATAALGSSGLKATSGSAAPITTAATLATAGAKGGRGTASSTVTASQASTGTSTRSGTASLSASASFSGSGRTARSGSGSLTATATLTGGAPESLNALGGTLLADALGATLLSTGTGGQGI